MRRQIKLFLIISVVLLVGLLAGKAEVKAGFCGVDEGYDATISVNAKKCFKNFGGAWSCKNNGTWTCNDTYSCKTSKINYASG